MENLNGLGDTIELAYKTAVAYRAKELGMTDKEYEIMFFGGTLEQELEYDKIWNSLSFEEKEDIIARLCY